MTRALPRSRMFAPLVYLAAVVLLVEEWCWDLGMYQAKQSGKNRVVVAD